MQDSATNKPRKPRTNTAITGRQLLSKKHVVMPFTGPWFDVMGQPEWGGSISIQGGSTEGKTHAAFQLTNYLANNFGAVLYNSAEEEFSLSFKLRYAAYNLVNCKHPVTALRGESCEEIRTRLSRQKAPKIVVIDTITYFAKRKDDPTVIDAKDFKKLLKDFPNVLFICLVHEDAGKLVSKTAQAVVQLSAVKLRAQGCRLFVKGSRYGGGAHYDIHPEKAAEYWDMATPKNDKR